MPTQNSKIGDKKNNPALAGAKHYRRWYFSALIIVIISAGIMVYQILATYTKAINLVNNSNQKMVAKTGIEIEAELNKNNIDLAEKIIEKKLNPPNMPSRVRNIFVYDLYAVTGANQAPTGTLPAVANPTAATTTDE